MSIELEPERLGAYVDGELDEGEARKVEALASRSPAVEREVRAIRSASTLVRAAFNTPLLATPPARLGETIDAGFAARKQRRTTADAATAARRRWALPIAASIAALFIGVAGGYFSAGYRFDSEFARLEADRQEQRAFIERTVNQALEKQLSGTAVNWRNPVNGDHVTITPVRTYRSESGKWCREYRQITTTPDGRTEHHRAIACRESNGGWVTRAELFTDS
ncbi:MAG: RT0821/Lpp0805 family surface protein [Alphaproteobacteria bacterium]